MLHFAWALAPDLVQMLFLFCARRSDANLIHKVFICACIDIGIYTCTFYHTYTHIYFSLWQARGRGGRKRAEGFGHMFASEGRGGGGAPTKKKQKMKKEEVSIQRGLHMCFRAIAKR